MVWDLDLLLVVTFLPDLEKYILGMVRVNLWVWVHLVLCLELGCRDRRLEIMDGSPSRDQRWWCRWREKRLGTGEEMLV